MENDIATWVENELLEQIADLQEKARNESDPAKRMKWIAMEKMLYELKIKEFSAESSVANDQENRRIQEERNQKDLAIQREEIERKRQLDAANLENEKEKIEIQKEKNQMEFEAQKDEIERKIRLDEVRLEIEKLEQEKQAKADKRRFLAGTIATVGSAAGYSLVTIGTYAYNARGNIDPRSNNSIGSNIRNLLSKR